MRAGDNGSYGFGEKIQGMYSPRWRRWSSKISHSAVWGGEVRVMSAMRWEVREEMRVRSWERGFVGEEEEEEEGGDDDDDDDDDTAEDH